MNRRPPRSPSLYSSAASDVYKRQVYLWNTATLPAQTEMIVPFMKFFVFPLGAVAFIAVTYFVIVGTSNAVNLTDGLDGLAIMPTVMVSSALALFAYVAGNVVFAKYLG